MGKTKLLLLGPVEWGGMVVLAEVLNACLVVAGWLVAAVLTAVEVVVVLEIVVAAIGKAPPRLPPAMKTAGGKSCGDALI